MATTMPPKIFKTGDTPLKLNIDPSIIDSFAIMRAVTKHGANLCTRLDDASVIIVDRHTREANATFIAYGQDPNKRILTPAWVKACISKRELIDGAEMQQFRITELTPVESLGAMEDDEAEEQNEGISHPAVKSHLPTPPRVDLHISRPTPSNTSNESSKMPQPDIIPAAKERPPNPTPSQSTQQLSSPSMPPPQLLSSPPHSHLVPAIPKPPILSSPQPYPPPPSPSSYTYAALAPKRSFNFQLLRRAAGLTEQPQTEASTSQGKEKDTSGPDIPAEAITPSTPDIVPGPFAQTPPQDEISTLPSNPVVRSSSKGKEKEVMVVDRNIETAQTMGLASSDQTHSTAEPDLALQPLFTFADFSTMTFCIDPGFKDLHELSALIRSNGGQIISNISSADFVLFNHKLFNHSFLPTLSSAISAKKPPLRPSFIHSCIDKGDIVDWHDFIVKNIPADLQSEGIWMKSEEDESREMFSRYRRDRGTPDEGTEAKVCYLLNKKFPHRHPRYFRAFRAGVQVKILHDDVEILTLSGVAKPTSDTQTQTQAQGELPDRPNVTLEDALSGRSNENEVQTRPQPPSPPPAPPLPSPPQANLLNQRDQIRSPSPFGETPVVLRRSSDHGVKYSFTLSERKYALDYIRVMVQRDPNVTPAMMAYGLAQKMPHHSQRSWAYHLYSRLMADIEDIWLDPFQTQGEPLPQIEPSQTTQGEPITPSESIPQLPSSSNVIEPISHNPPLVNHDLSTYSQLFRSSISVVPPIPTAQRVENQMISPNEGASSQPIIPARSPSPFTGQPFIRGGGRYYFTPEEDTYAIRCIRTWLSRNPCLSFKKMSVELAERMPHHSSTSWLGHLYNSLVDDIRAIEKEFPRDGVPTQLPSTASAPDNTGGSTEMTTLNQTNIITQASSSRPYGAPPIITPMEGTSSSERIRSPTPISWTPVPFSGGRLRFTPEENEHALACARVLIQRNPHVTKEAIAIEISGKIPTHSMASWRVHIARDLEDSISKFREDYVQQLPSSSGIIPAENDGAQPARDLGAHRNAPVPNVTPGDSLRSPSPPTTATADSRGYRYTDIEVTWVLDYISVLLQRNPNIRNMEIAKAVFEKAPHHPLASWSTFLTCRIPDKLQILRNKYASHAKQRAIVATRLPPSNANVPHASSSELDTVDEMLSPTISDELSNSSGPQIDRQADDTGVTFTTTDACNLARYLATNTITDRQLKWQGFEELNPHHSWESWAEFYRRRQGEIDRYITIIKHSKNAAPVSGESQKRVRDESEEIVDLSPDKRPRLDSTEVIEISDSDDD